MKKACVVRYGAYGDGIMISPIFPFLKRAGYHVTLQATNRVMDVLRYNPHIDKFVLHKTDSVPNDELPEYWEKLKVGYDRFINLSGSIEGGLLPVQGSDEFMLPKEERHEKFNHNYYDKTMDVSGFPVKGVKGELHFSWNEKNWAKKFRKKHKNKFLILWSLSGSSYHKSYPYTEYVSKAFLATHPDAMIVTVGDVFCKMLEWESHPQVLHRSDEWAFRKSMVMTKYADLVIGPETGIMNASGCFDTPKIVLLSHSSKENLTKYFDDCFSIYPKDCWCYPCHRLIYLREACPKDKITDGPLCMASISHEVVLDCMQTVYEAWKMERSHNGAFC